MLHARNTAHLCWINRNTFEFFIAQISFPLWNFELVLVARFGPETLG
jgi:hypothetical protein